MRQGRPAACAWRFGSARYSGPVRLIVTQWLAHRLTDGCSCVSATASRRRACPGAPGDHRCVMNTTAARPRHGGRAAEGAAEKAFLRSGYVRESLHHRSAAAGHTLLDRSYQLNTLGAVMAMNAFAGRAGPGGRVRRCVLVTSAPSWPPGPHAAPPFPPGRTVLELPVVPAGRCRTTPSAGVMTACRAAAGPRPHRGLRRLNLAAMRRLSPELLVCRTQRWAPEELLAP